MKRFLLALALVAAPALASDDPVKDTRQILAGTVTTGGTAYKAYLSGARDNTTAFQGALKAYKAVRAAEKSAEPVPVPTPVPVPPVPPSTMCRFPASLT